MKKKIIGIIGLMILTMTIFTATSNADIPAMNLSNNDSFFDIFIEIGNFSMGTKIIIRNIGDLMISDIEWTFNASGGTIVFGDGVRGRIPTSLDPTDQSTIILMPAPRLFNADGQSPIGIGAITMKVTVKGTVGSTLQSYSETSDAFLLGPFILLI